MRKPGLWLVVYISALALIALWPVPVDRGARRFVDQVTAALPWLSYGAIESAANVALFIPFGFLVALALPLARWLAVLLGLAASLAIELAQGILLAERTSTWRDVVANTAGAALGLGLALVVRRRAGSRGTQSADRYDSSEIA